MKKIIYILCISLFAIGFAAKSLEALNKERSALRAKMGSLEKTMAKKYKKDETFKALAKTSATYRKEVAAAKKAGNKALIKKKSSLKYKADQELYAFYASKDSNYKKLFDQKKVLRSAIWKAKNAK